MSGSNEEGAPTKARLSFRYGWNLLWLWISGRLRLRVVLWAVRTRPRAVCGKGGSFAVDPDLDY